jgi:hypothetical protein
MPCEVRWYRGGQPFVLKDEGFFVNHHHPEIGVEKDGDETGDLKRRRRIDG